MKRLSKNLLPLVLLCLFGISCNSEKQEQNYKSTVHTFNEAWNTGKVNLLDEVVHPEYIKLEGDLELNGIEALKEYVRNYRKSYIDVKITYIDEVYGQEKAAINFIIEALPKATAKRFKAEGIVIFRFRDGKIIEDHSVFDQLSALMQQGYYIEEPKE